MITEVDLENNLNVISIMWYFPMSLEMLPQFKRQFVGKMSGAMRKAHLQMCLPCASPNLHYFTLAENLLTGVFKLAWSVENRVNICKVL